MPAAGRSLLVWIAAAVVSACGGGAGEESHEPYDLRVGAWNVERLGLEPDTDYGLLARVVEENFDVVAVEEVMWVDGGHPGYDRLLVELGPGWDGFVTDGQRPDVEETYAEYYAVLWRRALVRPCAGWTGLVYHADAANVFSREPAFACLEAGFGMDGVAGTVGFDFVLAAYHAIWAGGDTVVTAAEVDHLDEVLAAMAAACPGEGDVLIAGDFNLEAGPIEAVVDATVLTEGGGSTLSDTGSISLNLIDHVLVQDPAATGESAGPATILDVRAMAGSNAAYRDTASNHLPVQALFTVSEDDD